MTWSALVRVPLFTLLAILFWKFQSQAICEVVIFAVFVYSVFNARQGVRVWLNGAGIAFVILFAFIVVTLPLSTSLTFSARDFVKMLPEFVVMFLIPIVFCTRARLEGVLFYSAVGLTIILGYDLIRLVYTLGPDAIAKAHAFEPFILNHSNVASMAAGAAFFVLTYFAWQWRRDQMRLGCCLLGMAVDIAYKIVIASRGPQIAFVVAIGVAGLILMPGWRKKLLWVLVPVIAGVVMLIVNPRFADKVSMKGLCDRDKVWVHTWTLITKGPTVMDGASKLSMPVLGYGFGKKVFYAVYHSTSRKPVVIYGTKFLPFAKITVASNPPASPFRFHHTHEYWLLVLFQHGWAGLFLYAVAWALLMLRLLRYFLRQDSLEKRLLPGLIVILLVFIHFYGLADYPDNIVQLMMLCLIPVVLAVTGSESTAPVGIS